MLLRRAALALVLPLSLAACGDMPFKDFKLPGFGKDTPPVAGPVAPPATPTAPAVSPLEVPIETGGPQVARGTASAEFVGVTAFTARGNEPFWSVDITGDSAVLKRPGVKDAKISVRRIDFGEGAEFIGVLGERAFSVTLRATDCTDSMAGTRWPMSASLKAAGASQTGCAAPAGQAPGDARPVAAAADKPKPAS